MENQFKYLISYSSMEHNGDECVCAGKAFLSAPIKTDEDLEKLRKLIIDTTGDGCSILSFSLMQSIEVAEPKESFKKTR